MSHLTHIPLAYLLLRVLQLPNINSTQIQILLQPRTELTQKLSGFFLFFYLFFKLIVSIYLFELLSFYFAVFCFEFLLLFEGLEFDVLDVVAVVLEFVGLVFVFDVVEEELGEVGDGELGLVVVDEGESLA